MKTTFKVLALATIISASTAAVADVIGKVDVKLNVSTGCIVEGAEVSGAINNFGMLDFGKTASGWTNVLTAQLVAPTNAGKIAVKCDGSEAVPFNVTVNSGLNGDRLLKHSSEETTVAYEVYQDIARSKAYVKDTKVEFTTTSGQSTEIPMFGSIKAGQGVKSQGDYTDTLLVNITF